MSDIAKEIDLIKEIIQSPHEFKYRYTSVQIVGWLQAQQQLIDQQAEEIKRLQKAAMHWNERVDKDTAWIISANEKLKLAVKALELIEGYRKSIKYQNAVGAVNWDMPYETDADVLEKMEGIANVALEEIKRLGEGVNK